MPEEKDPFNTPDLIQARKDQADPLVMYLIVRESLGMGPGKIGAQCGHAVGMIDHCYLQLVLDAITAEEMCGWPMKPEDKSKLNIMDAWIKESYRKVVLKADDKEWEKIKKELNCFVVRDAGLTEIACGSETVIGLWPMKKSEAPKLVKRLQILK